MNGKKTLVFMLLIPFIVGLLSFVSVAVVYNAVGADIVDISWKYQENEGFKKSESGYLLEATPVIDESLALSNGNDLVWSLKDLSEEGVAEIKVDENKKSYLYALKDGNCEVVCSNEKGTKSKHFNCYVFTTGAVIVNPKRMGSGEKIDKTKYYGEYDLQYDGLKKDGYKKVLASTSVIVTLFGESTSYRSEALTNNVTASGDAISFLDGGEATVRYTENAAPYEYTDYSFSIVEDAVNVYSYDDLLMATNFSSKGEAVVLQTNLESLKNTYEYDEASSSYTKTLLKENTALFGNYDFKNKSFDFADEIYAFPSTYDTSFIDQYDKAKGTSTSKDVLAGIHFQKSLYGNGYTLNAHELAYPNNGKIGSDGKLAPDKSLDLFQGPLPYITIGNISESPIVKAYGQDDIGFYLDGDDILVDDVRLKDCNDIDNLYNLLYVGTTLEIRGNGITVKNSILSNGRNVVRCFKGDGLSLNNCIIKNAGEFLAKFGSEKANSYDTGKEVSYLENGVKKSKGFSAFFDDQTKNGYNADTILNTALTTDFTSDKALLGEAESDFSYLQAGLDDLTGIEDINGAVSYDYSATIKNCSFAHSSIFSIALESRFNGPYLYSGLPSVLSGFASSFSSVTPNKIGGTSCPIKLILDSSDRFYDYKEIDSIDVASLVGENISSTVNAAYGKDLSVTINDFFPLKSVLKEECRSDNYIYATDGKQYLDTKIAWYGGGANLSSVDYTDNDEFGSRVYCNLVSPMLSGKYINSSSNLLSYGSKAILMAIGAHPFSFLTNGTMDGNVPKYYGESPSIETLIDNAN